jgi:hypothetical protein
MYVTKSMIELNNEMNDLKIKDMEARNKMFMDKMKEDNDEMKKRLDKRWF